MELIDENQQTLRICQLETDCDLDVGLRREIRFSLSTQGRHLLCRGKSSGKFSFSERFIFYLKRG
jgi:hypothetical protein